MEQVLAMIDESKSSFEFRIYKVNLSLARHTGVLVLLDGIRKFSIDVGHELAESGSSGRMICLFVQPNSVITINEPKTGFNIQESPTIQRISLESCSGKETAKKVIRDWWNYEHGDYDMLSNNCRHFCSRYIWMAETYGHINKDGRAEAGTMLDSTIYADNIYQLAAMPITFLRHAIGGKLKSLL